MKYFVPLLIALLMGCGKSFLKAKSSSTSDIEISLNALKASLNKSYLSAETPVLGEQSSDDYYLTAEYFNRIAVQDRNVYLWAPEIYEGKINIPDWTKPYGQIAECNHVLAELKKIVPDEVTLTEYKNIKGAALFIRSYFLFNIAQVFAGPYDINEEDHAMGIAIPLEDSLDIIPARSNMKTSYARIINDIVQCIPLLSSIVPKEKNFPSKPAAYALLARVYLAMNNYPAAGLYADSCLTYNSAVMNYNSLDTTGKFPFIATNEEVLYQSWMITTSNIIQGKIIKGTIIDSVLYNAYDDNDIRKRTFFMLNDSGKPIFKCNYTGKSFAFSGLALDEIFLIRAECNARKGSLDEAITDLNNLIEKRYKPGTFTRYKVIDANQVLYDILKERRKELCFRGVRWSDIKRLKSESNIRLSRVIGDSVYWLLPNSHRFALPIPDDALKDGKITQNSRD